jgi:hypothetical protein
MLNTFPGWAAMIPATWVPWPKKGEIQKEMI